MNKVIEFPDIEDLQIQMERTEDFYKAARALKAAPAQPTGE